MMWVYSLIEDVPILDDYEFLKRIKAGKELVYRVNQGK